MIKAFKMLADAYSRWVTLQEAKWAYHMEVLSKMEDMGRALSDKLGGRFVHDGKDDISH